MTLPPATGRLKPDPSQQPCKCEICGAATTVGDSYSFAVMFATTGPQHVQYVQCPAEQHFCCCIEHAHQAAIACMDEHLIPEHARRVAEGQS
jgi:hypothetical protein